MPLHRGGAFQKVRAAGVLIGTRHSDFCSGRRLSIGRLDVAIDDASVRRENDFQRCVRAIRKIDIAILDFAIAEADGFHVVACGREIGDQDGRPMGTDAMWKLPSAADMPPMLKRYWTVRARRRCSVCGPLTFDRDGSGNFYFGIGREDQVIYVGVGNVDGLGGIRVSLFPTCLRAYRRRTSRWLHQEYRSCRPLAAPSGRCRRNAFRASHHELVERLRLTVGLSGHVPANVIRGSFAQVEIEIADMRVRRDIDGQSPRRSGAHWDRR